MNAMIPKDSHIQQIKDGRKVYNLFNGANFFNCSMETKN
jgi:hypothetical protein